MEFVTENDASEWACLFHRNGRFEINPKYTVDEAAKEFCRLVNAEHQRVVEVFNDLKTWFLGSVDCPVCGDVLFIHDPSRRTGTHASTCCYERFMALEK